VETGENNSFRASLASPFFHGISNFLTKNKLIFLVKIKNPSENEVPKLALRKKVTVSSAANAYNLYAGVISGALLYIRDDFEQVEKSTVLQVLDSFFFFFLMR
jgi:hypothetical protein